MSLYFLIELKHDFFMLENVFKLPYPVPNKENIFLKNKKVRSMKIREVGLGGPIKLSIPI